MGAVDFGFDACAGRGSITPQIWAKLLFGDDRLVLYKRPWSELGHNAGSHRITLLYDRDSLNAHPIRLST
jgi:hypothetical protein